MQSAEVDRIVDRYKRRTHVKYDVASPSVYMIRQEKQRALLRWIRKCNIAPICSKRVLEIGCGSGDNLLEFLQLGFRAANLSGNELLPDRFAAARERLPSGVGLFPGDALQLHFPKGSFDIVLQSTVFSSILDRDFQYQLAQEMWRWSAPGGGILWYDFIYNNPRNPDVAGIPLRRIRALFPKGRVRYWRVTLAPPLSRLVTQINPALYTLFNALPPLRTHVLCWIEKTIDDLT